MTNSELKAMLTAIARSITEASMNELNTRYSRALVFCEALTEGSLIRERIVLLFAELSEAQGGMLREAARGFDMIEHFRSPHLTEIQWQRRRNRLVTLLVDTIEQLPGDPVRPDGYTAKELQAQADIGPDLWRTFCQLAGFDLTPRDNHRRFDFKDVEALISAAQSYGKRKGGPAAKAWEELLDMNRDALSSKP
ncbi:MAG: hypothetical protein AAFO89_01350 [Planctomycetota bacterium]